MTSYNRNITANGAEQLIRTYKEHKQPITGLIEVGGDFGEGTLRFLLSLSEGGTINPWNDWFGSQFVTVVPITREFTLPVVSMVSGHLRLFYTLAGATNPDITITIGDNT